MSPPLGAHYRTPLGAFYRSPLGAFGKVETEPVLVYEGTYYFESLTDTGPDVDLCIGGTYAWNWFDQSVGNKSLAVPPIPEPSTITRFLSVTIQGNVYDLSAVPIDFSCYTVVGDTAWSLGSSSGNAVQIAIATNGTWTHPFDPTLEPLSFEYTAT